METAAFGALVQVVGGKLLDMVLTLAGNEYGEFGGFKQDLEKLEKFLIRFQDTVEQYEVTIFKNKSARLWYDSVKFAVNDADRILEEADGVLHLTHQPYGSDHHQQVCSSLPTFSSIVKVWNRRKLCERIASLLQKFENLDVEDTKLDLKEIDLTLDRGTISSLSGKVYGREDEKEKIVNILLNYADTQSVGLNIYAMIGLGGIGKTTLAQLIYNDTRVKEKFGIIIWVWVSQIFDVKIVMKKIIETVSDQDLKFESLEAVQSHLKTLLGGKKFLLVLDDVWNEDQEKWNKLKSTLNFGATGSCILLTTREVSVASIALARDQHKLPVLSKDQCWKVFKESAYFNENQENGELVAIGKRIAEKCGGLPLAAKSLGASLGLTRDEHAWELVRDSHIWEQSGDILPALKLSLDRLDPHLRNCFTFCCVFPKGYKMDKEELILLWMANDLIPSHPRLELKEVGNKKFNDLVVKSSFQNSANIFYPIRVLVTMHDVCLYFRNECFCLEGLFTQISQQIQHLSVDDSYSLKTNLLETLSKSHSSLRTCIFLESFVGKKINFKPLYCLRVLKLSNARLEDLPISIGNVKDLKYLNLCGNSNLTHLPDSIGDLIKLQTLKLSGCLNLTKLPEGITRLVNLRHLDLSWCNNTLTHLPDGIGGLMNLRHLDLSACEKLTHLPDGMTGLAKLEHLHLNCCHQLRQFGMGQLVNLRALMLDSFVVGPDDEQRIIEWESNLEEWEEVQLKNNQKACPCLKEVKIGRCESLKSLPECLRNLSTLEDLRVDSCDQLELSSEDFQSLISLELLDLENLPKLTSFPALQHFSKLKRLATRGCKNLISLVPQGMMQNSTTVLWLIKFQDCEQLELSSTDFQHLLKLEGIHLSGLPKLTSLPQLQHLPSLYWLEIWKCKNLKILPHWLQLIKQT